MFDYEFMKNTVIMSAFIFIILLDIWGIGYWITRLVKWIWKKVHGEKDVKAEDTMEIEE